MKKFFYLLLTFLVIISSVLFLEFKKMTNQDISSQTNASSTLENTHLPTQEELKKIEGENIECLGNYQIVTVNFNQGNVVLSNHDDSELTFAISNVDKQNNTFSIPEITYSSKKLKITDSFGIAKKHDAYFAYKVTP